MKRLLIVVAVLAVAACSRDRARKPPAPSEQPSLAQRVADEVRARAPELRVEVVNDREVRVYGADDKEGSTTYLDNLARICEVGEAECKESFEQFVATAVKMGQSLGEALPIDPKKVLATLKHAEYVIQLQQLLREKDTRDAGPPAELLTRRFIGDLRIVYVEDSAESMRMVMSTDLEELKLDAGEVHALAIENMQRAFPKIPHQAVDGVPNTWAVTAGDSYDAARLLLHGQWEPLAAGVDGQLVVAVPSRDLAVFSGTAFPDAVRDLRGFAEQSARTDAYPLTGALFRWTPDGWVVHTK